MKTTDLNKDVIKYIINDIAMSCRRLGIDTTFYFNGNESDALISTSFQTMPVLFKEIHIEGDIDLEEDNNYIKMYVRLRYQYRTFDNGTNGHLLGNVIYVIAKDYNESDIRNISMYIDKVRGIAI